MGVTPQAAGEMLSDHPRAATPSPAFPRTHTPSLEALPGSTKTDPRAADRNSRLPENMPDIGGWLRRLAGRMPDSDDGLSGFPENTPGNVGRLPCLQKETAAKAGGFPSLRENTLGNAGGLFARRNSEGIMGLGMFFGRFSQKGAGR
jgi:hypothetical protein